MRIHPSGDALGASISGVDLSQPLDAATVVAIRRAWLEHLVLFFRNQPLSPAQFMAFARNLGEPVEYPFVAGLPGHPKIVEVKKLEHETVNFGGIWHSDTTYLQEPPMASLLLAREVPARGGDTLFANMYAAYETLAGDVKARLEGVAAVNSSAKAEVSLTRQDRIRGAGRPDSDREHVAEHPAVRTHPETGRKALYVNVAHTVGLRGVDPAASAALLEQLFQHQVRPEFTTRFVWQPGSLAIWDNRCTLHYPVNDYQGARRVMHRITLAGAVPR